MYINLGSTIFTAQNAVAFLAAFLLKLYQSRPPRRESYGYPGPCVSPASISTPACCTCADSFIRASICQQWLKLLPFSQSLNLICSVTLFSVLPIFTGQMRKSDLRDSSSFPIQAPDFQRESIWSKDLIICAFAYTCDSSEIGKLSGPRFKSKRERPAWPWIRHFLFLNLLTHLKNKDPRESNFM